jgi:hypothetical protein
MMNNVSAIAVPYRVIRSASHLGTLPPCSGRSAIPDRCMCKLYRGHVLAGLTRDMRSRIDELLPFAEENEGFVTTAQ